MITGLPDRCACGADPVYSPPVYDTGETWVCIGCMSSMDTGWYPHGNVLLLSRQRFTYV